MSERVTVRLADGHPAQEVPGFGACDGGGTLEVTERAAADLCCAPHWSRVGSAAGPKPKAKAKAKEPEAGGKE